MCAAVLIFWDPLAIEFKVSRRDIAGIWVAFFQGCQQCRCGQGEVGDAPKSAIRVGDYKLVRNATAQHTAPGREHHRVMEASNPSRPSQLVVLAADPRASGLPVVQDPCLHS